jgi:single-strand DNA-binding protein
VTGGSETTVTGNLTADPELRFTRSGTAVAHFTIASAPKTFDVRAGKRLDGDTVFVAVTAWRGTAEHAAASLAKGMRVIATGTVTSRSYTTKAGEERTLTELEIEDIGPSLRSRTAEITRTGPGPEQDEEHPPDRFALSAREYAGDDLWFGLAANPTGVIDVPVADPEPALWPGTPAGTSTERMPGN